MLMALNGNLDRPLIHCRYNVAKFVVVGTELRHVHHASSTAFRRDCVVDVDGQSSFVGGIADILRQDAMRRKPNDRECELYIHLPPFDTIPPRYQAA